MDGKKSTRLCIAVTFCVIVKNRMYIDSTVDVIGEYCM